MGKTNEKKQFYDEYDALFIKPKLAGKSKHVLPEKRKTTKSAVATKPQANQPSIKNKGSKKRMQKEKTRIRDVVWPVSIFLIGIFLAFYFNGDSDDSLDNYDNGEEYVSVYPLQDAGIKRTGKIDISQPLVATLDEQMILFNRGYKLEVKGDVDIKQQQKELSVLPTDESYPNTLSIASLAFYSGRDYLRSVNIGMSGNLIASMSDYIDKAKGEDIFTKAYPQKSVEGLQTGYVVEYEKEKDYIYLNIKEYFIFEDGTGIWIETYSSSDEKQVLHSDDSFEKIKKEYQKDFDFLKESFVLTKEDTKEE